MTSLIRVIFLGVMCVAKVAIAEDPADPNRIFTVGSKQYTRGDLLGAGQGGAVYKLIAKDVGNKRTLIVKILKERKGSATSPNEADMEVAFHKALEEKKIRTPYVQKLDDRTIVKGMLFVDELKNPTWKGVYSDQTYYNKNFQDLVKAWDELCKSFSEGGIFVGDFKADNVMLDKDKKLYVVDGYIKKQPGTNYPSVSECLKTNIVIKGLNDANLEYWKSFQGIAQVADKPKSTGIKETLKDKANQAKQTLQDKASQAKEAVKAQVSKVKSVLKFPTLKKN